MKRWFPWLLVGVALMVCPIGMATLGTRYERHGPYTEDEPLPWPARMVERFLTAHLVLSALAATSMFGLAHGGRRWLAWCAILGWLVFTYVLSIGAWMATTGIYF